MTHVSAHAILAGMFRRDARSLTPEAQQELRQRAIEALKKGGMTQEAVASLLGVRRPTVAKWWAIYKKKGAKGLRARRRGRPPEPRLKGHQAATIKRIIVDRCPNQLKLPFALWTRAAVGQLIEKRFGLKLSRWTVGRYLRRWGFTPQKPARRALERDPIAVKKWLDEEYPAIRDAAKKEGAEILWGDEMGARSDHQSGLTWGKRGRTPIVAGTGKRFGCNMISAISNRGSLRFRIFTGRFNAPVFIDFLKRLIKTSKHKLILIVDGHPAHRAKLVQRWVAGHSQQIQLHFLPGYSPDLNPDEFLNNDVKSNAIGRKRASSILELTDNLRSYLRGRQRQPDLVRRYFHASPVRYAG